jgi:hypothetical protein
MALHSRDGELKPLEAALAEGPPHRPDTIVGIDGRGRRWLPAAASGLKLPNHQVYTLALSRAMREPRRIGSRPCATASWRAPGPQDPGYLPAARAAR